MIENRRQFDETVQRIERALSLRRQPSIQDILDANRYQTRRMLEEDFRRIMGR